MRCFVTGASGFVGANLVRELLADGHAVRVLARPGGDRRALDGCAVEIVEGDLLDAASLRRAVSGARHVYHAAADSCCGRKPSSTVNSAISFAGSSGRPPRSN